LQRDRGKAKATKCARRINRIKGSEYLKVRNNFTKKISISKKESDKGTFLAQYCSTSSGTIMEDEAYRDYRMGDE